MYVYVFRLIEDGRVAVTAVVYVDDTFAVGQNERCGRLCAEISGTITVKGLGESKWCRE